MTTTVDYPALTPAERTQRTVQAVAASDFAEVRRLINTAPRRTTTSADPEYLDRARMVLRVAIQYELELRGLALTWHNLCTGNQQAGEQIRAEAGAAAHAWTDFCAVQGLEPADLITAVGGHHPLVIGLVRWAPAPPPDLVEKWRGLFQIAASGEMFGESRH